MAGRNSIDLVGERFDQWVVFAEGERTPGGARRWWCRCSCSAATTRLVQQGHLIHGKSRSCGCLQKMHILDLTGQTFVRWTIESEGPRTTRGQRRWWAVCSCEKNTRALVNQNQLIFGSSTSCGCLRDENALKANTLHGKSKTREHVIWRGIVLRCTNPKYPNYRLYGGRGIKVCERWQGPQGFINFLADMGETPFPGASIDRYPNNQGDYSPENCRWADAEEQGNNTSRCKKLVMDGEELTVSQWARRFGVKETTVRGRLKRGWELKESLSPSASRPVAYEPFCFIA